MWWPFVLAVLGWPVGFLFWLVHLEILGALCYGTAATSCFLLIPYAGYLSIVRRFWPPETEREYRHAMRLAPVGTGVIAAVLVTAGTAAFNPGAWHGLGDVLKTFGFASNGLLIIGYVYVAFCEIAISEFKRKRALRLGLDQQVVGDD
jgi:hypothetical protein